MKPTCLKPGRSYEWHSHGRRYSMAFIRRDPAECGRAAVNVFRVPEFAGINGPADPGTTHFSDYAVSREVVGIEQSKG